MIWNGIRYGQDGPGMALDASLPRTLLLCSLLVLSGCASSPALGERFEQTLQAVGLGRASSDESPTTDVHLQLHAGRNLNGGSAEQPLALVVRLYQLRDPRRFEATPFDAFLDEDRERVALGPDLLAVRELLLLPDQRYDVTEALEPGADHIGVVALFRAPASTRWRFVFDSADAAQQGAVLGFHACAMTTTSPALRTRLGSPPHSLAAASCPR